MEMESIHRSAALLEDSERMLNPDRKYIEADENEERKAVVCIATPQA